MSDKATSRMSDDGRQEQARRMGGGAAPSARPSAALRVGLVVSLFLYVALIPLAVVSLLAYDRPTAEVALHAVFILIVAEKLVSMLGRMHSGRVPPPMRDVSMFLTGCAFTGLLYAVLFTLWRRDSATGGAAARGAGLLLYAGAMILHYWASRHLAGAMAGRASEDSRYELVLTGPYTVVRHPIYLAACMEALAFPLIFLSAGGLAISVLLFIPLEVYRSIKEDRYIRDLFGESYEAYAARVPSLWPRMGPPMSRH